MLDLVKFHTAERILTPNEILKIKYPERDINNYYLVLVSDNRTEAKCFKGKMASAIIIDEGMNFVCVKNGVPFLKPKCA